MSKTWYPMIDYDKCVECGICVNKCTHGVYNKDKAPRPVVVYPEGCVHKCTGCGSLCPQAAISYFGDNAESDEQQNCNCGCSCDDNAENDEQQGCNCSCSCDDNC